MKETERLTFGSSDLFYYIRNIWQVNGIFHYCSTETRKNKITSPLNCSLVPYNKCGYIILIDVSDINTFQLYFCLHNIILDKLMIH